MLSSSVYLAPPRLLFSMYSNLIRRVNTDGEDLVTIYTASYARALDYDFRSTMIQLIIMYTIANCIFLLYYSRKGYVFWVNFNNDWIVRGQGIEMPSTYENLVTSDISCAGM